MALAVLVVVSGSGVELAAVAVADTGVAGITKLTLQTTALPEGSEVTGTDGVQLIVAAGGKPAMLQLAAMALSVPPLVQVKLPVTVLPTNAAVGRLTVALMFANEPAPNVTDALPGGLRPTEEVMFDALLV